MARFKHHLATIFGGPARSARTPHTIDDYCDAALARHPDITSDRQLGAALDLSPGAVSHWRCSRMWPAPETMVRLAALAGAEADQALLDLGRWSAKSRRVKALYSRMAEKIRSTASQILVFGVTSALLAAASPAQAEQTPHESTLKGAPYTLCDNY
ncbi:MAG: hypothetical protein IH904_05070 [Proteobacteria bacterium]|nr:hypothetical protein [Pseudomonadota bacterium]